MGWQTAASRLYSARWVMKRLNGKEDISILCEILLHFISGFFSPTLIAFPVVSSDTLHVTRARLCGWRFIVWSRLFCFFLCFGQNDKRILSERRKGQWDAQREPNPVRVFTGRFPSWHQLKLVEQRLLKNNGGCWPSTKCQSRLWELLEIPIERATFPRVQELVSQQTTRRDQQGHATGSRQTGKLLNLRQHFQDDIFPRSAQFICLF